MLDLSPEKIFLVGLIALVVLGPNRLPKVARTLGHAVGQLRHMSSSFQTEVRDALAEPTEALTSAMGVHPSELRPSAIRRSVREAVTSAIVPPEPNGTKGSGAAPALPGPLPTAAGGPPAPDDPSLN